MTLKDNGDGTISITAPYNFNKEISLRDYFASKAMQALINDEKLKATIIEMNQHVSKTIPKLAYEYADAMIKAREQ